MIRWSGRFPMCSWIPGSGCGSVTGSRIDNARPGVFRVVRSVKQRCVGFPTQRGENLSPIDNAVS